MWFGYRNSRLSQWLSAVDSLRHLGRLTISLESEWGIVRYKAIVVTMIVGIIWSCWSLKAWAERLPRLSFYEFIATVRIYTPSRPAVHPSNNLLELMSSIIFHQPAKD